MRKGSLGVTFFSVSMSVGPYVRPSVCPQILGNSIRNARDGWGWGRPPPDPPPVSVQWTGSRPEVDTSVLMSVCLQFPYLLVEPYACVLRFLKM